MPNPSYFVGKFDWRSVVLALVITLPWVIVLGRGRLRRPLFWLALIVGAVVFPFSIAWIQVPIQNALGRLLSQLLSTSEIRRLVLLVGIPSVAVSGIVQEGVKFGVAVGVLALLGRRNPARSGLAIGAAVGAGFGGFEAFWVFNTVFSSGITWATVQLGGVGALLWLIERIFTVPFHVGAAALSAYGIATRRPWRFLLLAMGLHSLSNYGVLLVQRGVLNTTGVEAWLALFSVATIGAALWLRHRNPVPTVVPTSESEPATGAV
jgi:uncharacterized membrane protein YhfC